VDADLAFLYGVSTKRLNEQVKRNRARFPGDFLFQLTRGERDEVVANCDHLKNLKFSPSMPYAFTEHGALMAFVGLRETLAAHKDPERLLNQLESKYDRQFKTVFDAIRELLTPPEPSRRRRIGFVQDN
jgi:hypothetical protein